MNKTRKKNIKRAVAFAVIAAVVIALAALPLLAKQEDNGQGVKASILSGVVTSDTIRTELLSGGTLTEQEAQSIMIPSEVKLTELLVENGRYVSKGTAIASVDRVSVMNAIAQVQETLEYLSEQIQKNCEAEAEETVSASAGGTVKQVYCKEGDAVQSVMLEHGCLAVLSLDGLMAVDLETESELIYGSTVTVTLSNGTEVSGKVVKNLLGQMTITVEDDGYEVDETVSVSDGAGTQLGEGGLYIYSPWNATAYTGTVGELSAAVDDVLKAGEALMTLTDVGYTASFRQLMSQRQQYEELMLELFQMYQSQTITAPCDGVVSGIDSESVQLLRSSDGFHISLLTNAPDGNDEEAYTNYVAKVTQVGQDGWSLLVNPQPVSVLDYADLSGLTLDEAAMTQACTYPKKQAEGTPTPAEPTEPTENGQWPAPPSEGQFPSDEQPPQQEPGNQPVQFAPIYERQNGEWQQLQSQNIAAGDILLFAANQNGEFVWIVRVQRGQQNDTVNDPLNNFGSASQNGGIPSGEGFTQGGGNSANGTWSQNGGFPQNGTGGFSTDAVGGMDGMTQPEQTYELYGTSMAEIGSVTPQDTMTLELNVDEQDVRSLSVGMEAQVRIDALGGEKHSATVIDIANTGSGNGGSSKFAVTLRLTRQGDMLPGMRAASTIVLGDTEQVAVVPVAALVEQGSRTLVYTGYDAENEVLTDPVEVKVGSSDGKNAEILSGLESGQTYYYAYYDTLEVSFAPDFGGSGFPF